MSTTPFRSNRAMILASMGIVINIVLGTIVSTLQIPLLFLDTMGTILVATVLGPLAGAMTGGLTNIIQGAITNPRSIPFALVNIAIGVIVGLVAKRFRFDLKTAIITGLALAIIAPLIGTPISIIMFGGLTGGGTDIIVAWLLASGQRIFTAAFIPRVTGNLVDKVASCIFVVMMLKYIPQDLFTTKAIDYD
ncbi:energy-coupling factor transport system substrate-specific component [Tindallia magadiensis]|uniref:Energy-coupling factor transport system substrate-specific component n=1 Tax=Tindallia magadiensis TaxID=69895 RepID=A0A1I3G5L5_9FIRM|nr:CD3073 family putative ECF transporter S component [Tindallia magadiensis]SFI18766.1 energy-coupling factor transport system substrate-specific component [Tindallia magadiensis]